MGRRCCRKTLWGLALVSVGAAMVAPQTAQAIRLQGRSSTAFYSQEVAKGGMGDDFENRTRAYERLRFDLLELGVSDLAFHGFLTLRNDLTNQSIGETQGRLYHGYLDYRPQFLAPGGIRLQSRLGRQWISAGVGSGTVDGLQIRLDRAGWGGITLFGGTLGIDTREQWRLDSPDDSRRLGAELRIKPRFGDAVVPELKASFADSRRDDQDESRRLGMRGALRIRRQLNLWTEVRHDFLLDRTYGTAAGVEFLKPAKKLRVWAEYNRRKAALPATSFFAFWDSKPVSELRGGLGFGVGGPYRLLFDFARTDFKQEATFVGGASRSKVDRSNSYRFVMERGAVQLGARFESGFGGDRTGLVASATHRIGERWDFLADLGWQTYEWGDTDPADNDAAMGIVSATYKATASTQLTGQVEMMSNRDLKQDLRFLLRIDQRFRLGRS